MPRIAIVEDDSAIREMYRIKFEDEGFKVGVADNGKLGLELAEKMKPDIILLDLMMPEMTGGEMLAQLRKKPWGKNIKVIVLTNVNKDDALPTLHHLKVDDFIIKAHYTPRQVVTIVKEILKQK